MDRIDPDGGVIIRRRRTEDAGEAADVLVEVHGTDGYPVEGVEDSEAWLFPFGLRRARVAEAGGRIVGHVAVSQPTDDEVASLWRIATPAERSPLTAPARLFVLPAVRRRAVGERLVRAATAYAHQHGLRLVLDVVVKDTAAIRLYRHLGWREFGTVVHPVTAVGASMRPATSRRIRKAGARPSRAASDDVAAGVPLLRGVRVGRSVHARGPGAMPRHRCTAFPRSAAARSRTPRRTQPRTMNYRR